MEFYSKTEKWKEYKSKIEYSRKFNGRYDLVLDEENDYFEAVIIPETAKKLEEKGFSFKNNDNVYVFTLCDKGPSVYPYDEPVTFFPICGIKDLEGNEILSFNEGLSDLLDYIDEFGYYVIRYSHK